MTTMTRVAAIGPHMEFNPYGEYSHMVELMFKENDHNVSTDPRKFYFMLPIKGSHVATIDEAGAGSLAIRSLFANWEKTHVEERLDGKS